MQNAAQYDLDRKGAKISALSSNNLDKYEYLTGEDLGLKPNTIEQARFEYFPLGKIFNKGLDKDDQKEGLFKRLKNIENAQKNLVKDDYNNKNIYCTPISKLDDNDDKDDKDKKLPNVFNYLKSLEANDLMDEIEEVNNDIYMYNVTFIGSNQEKFNFNTFRIPLNFLSDICYGKISLKEAEFEQKNLEIKIRDLYGYEPKNKKEKEEIN